MLVQGVYSRVPVQPHPHYQSLGLVLLRCVAAVALRCRSLRRQKSRTSMHARAYTALRFPRGATRAWGCHCRGVLLLGRCGVELSAAENLVHLCMYVHTRRSASRAAFPRPLRSFTEVPDLGVGSAAVCCCWGVAVWSSPPSKASYTYACMCLGRAPVRGQPFTARYASSRK